MAIYSIYLASFWTIFGKNLLISHLAILPFVIGLIFQFNKLANRFLDKKLIPLAFLLLLIEPTMLTQTLMAGYDIVSCYLFLMGLNSVFGNKRYMIAFSMIILPVINLRGFTLVASLFLIDLYINSTREHFIKKTFKIFLAYLPSIFFLFGWMFYHYMETGWYAVSINRDRYHHLNGLEIIFRNIIYIIWKIIDFGRIIIFLFIIIFFFKTRKLKDTKVKTLFFIMLFSVLPYCIFLLPFSYPVSHRHFMITYIISIITFIYFVGFLKQNNIKIVVLVITFLCLIAGNFIIYPERYGNGWDASIKGYPYFEMKMQLDSFLKKSDIEPSAIGTKFPIDFDNYDVFLSSEHFQFTDIDKKPLNKFKYIVQSNISNNFTPANIEELNHSWVLMKEFRSWQVYIKLFKNPEYYNENKN